MKYVVVNKNDRSLKPFVIWLPKPPNAKYMDNFRIKREKQFFHKTQQPQRLLDLEDRITDEMRQAESADKNKNRFTKQGLVIKMWDFLLDNSKDYKKEIDFIKREQYRLTYGYWVIIEGEPTYIPRWHYRYLNYWTLDGGVTPEFRFRDLEYFLVHEYAWNTTENADYVDTFKKTILGVTYAKHRRDGATNKSLCILYSLMVEGSGVSGVNQLLGIQSYNDNNAAKQFHTKLMPAFDKMPFYTKPLWNGIDMPRGELRLTYPSARKTLGSKYNYANTAGSGFYDGDKLLGILTDETGKTLKSTVDVLDRHEVMRKCVTLGNESKVIGFMLYPTTVADTVSGGGGQFQKLCNMSHFHDRNDETGQTMSGLINYFKASIYGMESFIDIFGKDVVEDPKESEVWRLKDIMRDSKGKLIGSRRYNLSKRAMLLKKNKITSYNNEVRLAPMEFAECFGGSGEDLGFDTVGTKKRINELLVDEKNEMPHTKRGYFVWKFKDGREITSKEFVKLEYYRIKGVTDNAIVKWVDDPNGRFHVSLLPRKNNRREIVEGVSYPLNPNEYTHSGDPFQFLNSTEINSIYRDDKSGSSLGGLAGFQERDYAVDPQGKSTKDLETFRFVYDYLFRPNETEEFGEDHIMALVYFGGLSFPERNVKNLLKYVIDRGFGGYLLYMTDATGKLSKDAGFNSLAGSKQELFSQIKNYTFKHVHKDDHVNILNQIVDIKGLKDMTNMDLFTAAAGCLYGSSSRYREYMGENTDDNEYNEEIFDFTEF